MNKIKLTPAPADVRQLPIRQLAKKKTNLLLILQELRQLPVCEFKRRLAIELVGRSASEIMYCLNLVQEVGEALGSRQHGD